MNQSRITAVLAEHYRALIEYSELDDSDVLQTAHRLCALDQPSELSVTDVLCCSELTHWRMAAGECVWDGSQPSSDFLMRQRNAAIDTWKEVTPEVSQRLVAEVLRVV